MPTRAACLAILVVGSAAWPCMPAPFEGYTTKGNTAQRLTVDVYDHSVELLKGEASVWKFPISGFHALFAPDDSWVAFSPRLRDRRVRIAGTTEKSRLVEVDLVSQLTRDEQAFLTSSSCGLQWFTGWEASAKGLRVFVGQNGQARPTEPPSPGIEFLITADGTVTRVTPKLEVDVLKLAEEWKGPASPARAEVAASIMRLCQTGTGRAQAAKLGPFVKRVFATADAQREELDGAAQLVGFVPTDEARTLTEVVLARPGHESALLWALPEGEGRKALATRLFKDPSRSGHARATAVRVVTGDGSAEYGPMLKAALSDADPEVRDSAASSAQRGKCTEPLLADVLAALAKELTTPTKVPNNEFAHSRLAGSLQSTVLRCLSDAKDPGRLATVAAAVDSGLRFEPDEYPTPQIYMALVVWAESAAPASVVPLLALAEASAKAQKYDRGPEMMNLVVQWRVLRALKARDLKTARAQLKLMQPTTGVDRVPGLETTDLGSGWKIEARNERTAAFVARMQQQIDPGKPATPAAKKK